MPQPVCVLSPTNDNNNTIYYTNDPNCEIYLNGALRFRLVMSNVTTAPATTTPAPGIGSKAGQNQNGSKGYSSSAGAGLGFFMLFLGGFLAVIGLIVYNKRKAAMNAWFLC